MIPQTMTDLVTKFENVPILGINIFQELRCYALKKVVNGKIKNTYLQWMYWKLFPVHKKRVKREKNTH